MSGSLKRGLTGHLLGVEKWSDVILQNRFVELEEVDHALRILSVRNEEQQSGSWKLADFVLPFIVLLARMSKPLANGVALAGRDDYPFLASSAQFVGLSLTALFFVCASACTPEFYMKKGDHDKKLMLASYIVGLIAGLGDVCEMLSNQFAGIGVATVILAASRIVITAVMSKVALGKNLTEIQVWSLCIVTLSIMAFGFATQEVMVQEVSFRLILGICLTMAAATFLSTQSIVKELFAGAKPADDVPLALNYHEKMIFLFAGAGTSSFVVGLVQLRGAVSGFFGGWEVRSLAVPLSVFVMSALSTLFTKQFGALTTVLLNIFSVVFVFLCCVLFFGQKYTPMVIVLIFLVALSVMMTTRGEKISKEEKGARNKLTQQLKEGQEVLAHMKEDIEGHRDASRVAAVNKLAGGMDSKSLRQPLLV